MRVVWSFVVSGWPMRARIYKFGFIGFCLCWGLLAANMLVMQPGGGARGGLAVEPGRSLTLAKKNGTRQRDAARASQGDLVIINSYNREETVRAIQRELTALGYAPGTADGVPGLMTRAAVMAFEFDSGLEISGRANPDLLKAILLGVPKRGSGKPPVLTSSGDDVVIKDVVGRIEHILVQLGYLRGPADGIFDNATSKAILLFESDQGLAKTGRVSGRLVARLLGVAESGRLAMKR